MLGRKVFQCLTFCMGFVLVGTTWAEDELQVSSPDGDLVFTLNANDAGLTYRVKRAGEMLVAPSTLGFEFKNMPTLGAGLIVTDSRISNRDETWEQPWGESRLVRDHHNELFVAFKEQGQDGRKINMRVRVFDDGVGFRYEFPAQGIQSTTIMRENTGFNLSDDNDAWWIPAREYNRYEYLYENTPLSAIKEVHTPITMRTKGGQFIALHEAALVDYAGMTLVNNGDGVYTASLAPKDDGSKVITGASFKTPWRVLLVEDSVANLITNNIILNLNEPNKLGDVSWVEPGKYVGVWWEMHIKMASWESGEIHGATTDNTKRYIDFAAKYGFDGVLVEGWNLGWDGDWIANGDKFSFTEAYPDYDIEYLADYARERGVRLVGHHETSAGITNYESQMEDGFDLFERLGIAQVKTGYVSDAGKVRRYDADGTLHLEHHDGQFMANHHERVLEAAAKRKISINSHEPIKATGLRRTYPNWISREGARGSEYDAWGSPANLPSHTAILPFTRMLGGPMDYTPGIFDLHYTKGNVGNKMLTTITKQLALYLVIYSPIQMAADLPESYEARPDLLQFIEDVPTDWEETVPLFADIGDHVVIARKERKRGKYTGDDWYVGGLSAEDARSVNIDLSFLDEGAAYEAQIYRDGEGAHYDTAPYKYVIESKNVTSADSLTMWMAPSGGFVIRFKKL